VAEQAGADGVEGVEGIMTEAELDEMERLAKGPVTTTEPLSALPLRCVLEMIAEVRRLEAEVSDLAELYQDAGKHLCESGEEVDRLKAQLKASAPG
jgi:hypothetical protein